MRSCKDLREPETGTAESNWQQDALSCSDVAMHDWQSGRVGESKLAGDNWGGNRSGNLATPFIQ